MRQKFYNIRIDLDSPYKWGDGWKEVDEKTQRKAKHQLLEAIVECDCFQRYESDDIFAAPIYYNVENKFEELYVHPTCISGCLTKKHLDIIVEYLKMLEDTNLGINKIIDVTIEDEARTYTFDEVMNVLNNISSETLLKIKNEYGIHLPENFDFTLIDLHYKEFNFAKCISDDKTNKQKAFVLEYLREKVTKILSKKESRRKACSFFCFVSS